MDRRAMLRSTLALAGAALAGCAPAAVARAPSPGGTRLRRLAPVRVEEDRVIRTIAGLRPYRDAGFVVRAERLGEKTLIHNYGHGGGGITLSWGSSELAAELAQASGHTRFAVLGSGVMGLTTARRLQDRGYQATIYTRDLPPDTTSNIAGGQWSPSSVMDSGHASPEFLRQFDRAARFSNRYYQNLVGGRYGVRWIENFSLRDTPPTDLQGARSGIADLYHDDETFGPGEHPFASRYAVRFTTLLVEPATFLPEVTRDFLLRGGRIVVRDFRDRSELLSLEEPAIVNCCGLGSRALFGDEELTPVKGQLAVLLPQEEVDYIVLAPQGYMFPRSDGIVLGGTQERGVWTPDPEPATIARIVAGHREVFGGMRG